MNHLTMLKESNTIRNPKLIKTRECYEFYKANRKKTSKTINQYNYFLKAVEGIFLVILKKCTEQQDGVYINGFGYIGNVYIKNRRFRTKVPNSLIRAKIEYKIYKPYFEPDLEFKDWTMNNTFSSYYFRLLIKSDIEYKVHFNLMMGIKMSEDFVKRKKSSKRLKKFIYIGNHIQKKLQKK